MPIVTIPFADERATLAFGADLLASIQAVKGEVEAQAAAAEEQAMCVYLLGDLGVGKTTLSRGLIRAAGYNGAVKSPTYTLVEPYDLASGLIYHFDLYRLSDPFELEFLGVEHYFDDGLLCLIEWPSKGVGFIPPADIAITLAEGDQQAIGQHQYERRMLTMAAESELGIAVLAHFSEHGSERWKIAICQHN